MHSKIVSMGFFLIALFMFLNGAALSAIIQLELSVPGLQFLSPSTYNITVKYHSLFMLFGTLVPALIGFTLWYLPQSLNTKNIVAPMMSYFFWATYVLGNYFILYGLVNDFQADAATGGWTITYGDREQSAPSATRFIQTEAGLLLIGLSLFFIIMSLMLTVVLKRRKSTGLLHLPPLAGSVLILAVITIVPLFIYLFMGLNELFFPDPDKAFEQLTWFEPGYFFSSFFEEPLFFMLLLFGLNFQVLMTVTNSDAPRKRANIMMLLMAVLFVISWLMSVWQTPDTPIEPILYKAGALMYLLATLLYLAGAIVLTGSLTRQRIHISPHSLFVFFGYAFFLASAIIAAMMLLVSDGFQYQDTWIVNSYRHMALFGGVLFTIFGSAYAVLFQWRTSLIAKILAYTHFLLTVIPALVLFCSYYMSGLADMLLNTPDYPLALQSYHTLNTAMTAVLLFAQGFFIAAIIGVSFSKKHNPSPA